MTLFLICVFAYMVGSIPFGLLLTRAAGLGDIRAIGSGNIGATNVLRTGRKGLAAATLLLDGAKGALAVLCGPCLWPWRRVRRPRSRCFSGISTRSGWASRAAKGLQPGLACCSACAGPRPGRLRRLAAGRRAAALVLASPPSPPLPIAPFAAWHFGSGADCDARGADRGAGVLAAPRQYRAA